MRRLLALALLPACATTDPDEPASVTDVFINEFVASNATGAQDEAGAFADWIELWNGGEDDADLTGHYLSDSLLNPTKWPFPEGTIIGAGAYMVIWADGDADGPLHASFSLAAAGEEIGLFGPLGEGAPQIDAVRYEAQQTDVSMARLPDGADEWVADDSPTPLDTNE
jgi:hypothetical protein